MDADGDDSGDENQNDSTLLYREGYTTVFGDCDDNDPIKQHFDVDEDGYSTCDGDCDDTQSMIFLMPKRYVMNGMMTVMVY